MPSRAYTSFLLNKSWFHIYLDHACVNALSGLYLISTFDNERMVDWVYTSVNALSGLYLISTKVQHHQSLILLQSVNALSGLYLISTAAATGYTRGYANVSMPSRAYTSFLQKAKRIYLMMYKVCQCPLGLIPHFYGTPSKT